MPPALLNVVWIQKAWLEWMHILRLLLIASSQSEETLEAGVR